MIENTIRNFCFKML